MPDFQSKVDVIANEIIELMKKGKLPSSGKLPSLRKIAHKHNVSRTTVHQAFLRLQNLGFIDIIAGRGAFAKDHSTIKQKFVRNKCISLIVHNVKGAFMLEIVGGAEHAVARRDCYLSIFNSLDDFKVERENIKKAMEIGSQGILLFPVNNVYPFCPNYDIYIEVQKQDMPLVFIDNYPLNLDVDYVVANDFKGIYDLTKFAVEMGHTKIAYFGGPTHISSLANRYRGYWQAMADAKLHIDTRLVFPNENTPAKNNDHSVTQFGMHTGARYLKKLLEVPDKPTTVIFSDLIHEYIEITNAYTIPDQLGIGCRGFKVEQEDITTPYNLKRFTNTSDDYVDIAHCLLRPATLGEKAAEIVIGKIEGEAAKGSYKVEIDMPLHKGNSIKKIGQPAKLKGKSLVKT